MERFENIMLKISRAFGLILMSIVLVIIIVVLTAIAGDYVKKLTAKNVPEIIFYKSDFVEAPKKDIKSDEIRPENIEVVLSKEIVEKIKPMYLKKLQAYVDEQTENLFGKDVKDLDSKRKEYIEKRVNEFSQNTQNSLVYYLNEYKEKYKKPFAIGLVKYIEKAEESGVEVVTSNKVPIYNLTSTKVLNKFSKEFYSQTKEISNAQEKESEISSMIAKIGGYLSLFFLIVTFLMLAVMFSIIRIEKKIK